MSLHSLSKLAACLSFLACTSAFAVPITINLGGDNPIESVGVFGDPANTSANVFVGANATISSISFSANLTAYPTSTLGDISVAFTDTTVTNGVFLRPASGNTASGTGTFQGRDDLAPQDAVFNVGSDGLLRLEFFELADDMAGADGLWNVGYFVIDVTQPDLPPAGVPEPASVALMAAGLAMMGYASRRRRRIASHSHTALTLH
jgi:hypothetical protein